jgi:hypothetical protein
MPYVMVPVPEEHVVEVMQFVTKLVAKASRQPWDHDAVERMFLRADEGARSLLSVVARATLADKEISTAEALRALELRQRDLASLVAPINEAAKEASRVPLLEMQSATRAGPGGRTRPVRNVTMDRGVAEMVRAAELRARAIEPHPLDRDAG